MSYEIVAQPSNLSAQYYAAYYGAEFKNLSFSVQQGANVLADVNVYKVNDILSLSDKGLKIQLKALPPKEMKLVYKIILDHLELLKEQHQCTQLKIQDDSTEGSLSLLGDILLSKGYQPAVSIKMTVNYKDFPEKTYFTSVRKSYKSLINWGKKNLEIRYVNIQNPSRGEFLKFKNLHHKVSGRVTRSDESWDIQFQKIQQGEGELILGYLKGDLVSGSLFLDDDKVSSYAVGVYNRELFEFPLAHYIMYLGVCRSYDRYKGEYFSFGMLDLQTTDKKNKDIEQFKRGFCPNLQASILWSI